MKKEEIYVIIDSEEKKNRAVEILENAGEKIWDSADALRFDDNDWFITHRVEGEEITLDQLEELLMPKLESEYPQEMLVWDEIEELKIQKTVLGLFNDQYVVFDPSTDGATYLTYLNASPIVEEQIPLMTYTCGRGDISIGVGEDYISFSVLSSPRKVGEDITGMYLPESDLTKVYFENVESLEVLQEKVDTLRRWLLRNKKQ